MEEPLTPEAEEPSIEDRIATLIQQQIKPAVGEVLDQRMQSYLEEPQPQQSPQALTYDQQLRQANFAAAAADDKANFYIDHPIVADGQEDEGVGSVSKGMRVQLEKLFADRARQGRPETREALYHFLLGQELATNPKGFTEKQAAKQKRAVEQAKLGMDVGQGSMSTQLSRDALMQMNDEQLNDALKDLTF